MTSLDGKKVLIFGGSRGIGLGVAKAALDRGAEVFIAGRSTEKLEAAEKLLGKNARLHSIAADMTKDADVARALSGFPPAAPVVWVQEEPANMGAWCHLASRFGDRLPGGRSLARVARSESASPATGSAARHRREQAALVEEALDG